MEDQEFLDRIKAKIEKLTGEKIEFQLDTVDTTRLKLELGLPIPKLSLGSRVLQDSGFARMAIEYAVTSIQQGRELSTLEFQALLSRN